MTCSFFFFFLVSFFFDVKVQVFFCIKTGKNKFKKSVFSGIAQETGSKIHKAKVTIKAKLPSTT